MTPQDKIKIIEEGRTSKFWEMIAAELNNGLAILTEELKTCELKEVRETRAKIQVIETILSTPDMVIIEQKNEIAVQELENEEKQPAER